MKYEEQMKTFLAGACEQFDKLIHGSITLNREGERIRANELALMSKLMPDGHALFVNDDGDLQIKHVPYKHAQEIEVIDAYPMGGNR